MQLHSCHAFNAPAPYPKVCIAGKNTWIRTPWDNRRQVRRPVLLVTSWFYLSATQPDETINKLEFNQFESQKVEKPRSEEWIKMLSYLIIIWLFHVDFQAHYETRSLKTKIYSL